MLTKINLEKSKFWVDSKGILYCKHLNCDKNWILNSSEVKQHILALLTLAGDKPTSMVIDLRDVRGVCAILATRMFTKDHSVNQIIISEAFIVNNLAVRVLIYAYKIFYEPLKSFKVFSNIKDAQEYSIKQIELVKESINNNNEVIAPTLILRDISDS